MSSSSLPNFSWHPEFLSPNFDTRRYSKDRLGIFAGWNSIPTARSGMDFIAPRTDFYTGRMMSYYEEGEDALSSDAVLKLELYSRNSAQSPFFPGLSKQNTSNPTTKRVDGSLGRFDHCKNPQYFDSSRPYYPFIARPSSNLCSFPAPEDVPAYLVWECSPYPCYQKGRILPKYHAALMDRTWKLRLQIRDISLDKNANSWPEFKASQPLKPDPCNWEEEMDFEDFVDNLVPLQRWIKEISAWIEMGLALKRLPLEPLLQLPESDITEANDQLLGVWINGMKEQEVAWFWMNKVPLFLVHEVKGGMDVPSAVTTQRTSDPFFLTDWVNNKVCDEWIGLSQRSKIKVIEDAVDENIADSPDEDLSEVRMWRSSSLTSSDNFPGLDTRTSAIEPDVPLMERYGPVCPVTKFISDNHVLWIVPPAVSKPATKGSWDWYIEETDKENDRCLRLVGKKARKELDLEDWPFIYYDRTRKRILYLCSEIIIPKGIAHDIEIFGIPGPKLKYYSDYQHRIRTSASNWVYKSEKPKEGQEDIVQDSPNMDFLPKSPEYFEKNIKNRLVKPDPSTALPTLPLSAKPSSTTDGDHYSSAGVVVSIIKLTWRPIARAPEALCSIHARGRGRGSA
ncbi:hypothetical protein VKT23_009461 [Stygiomarasmius scandens]|uniref:Uncharacterized protein n=1 Tax=Marasmiellus scandens TaxID=2682957 RepID=A0ABR1JEH0_9AGAR